MKFFVSWLLVAGTLCVWASMSHGQSSVDQKVHSSSDAASEPSGRADLSSFQPGNPDIALSVNLPAFRLSLWQGGREVIRYPIGIAQAKFPIPVGEYKAWAIMWNPPWIPPDSPWVHQKRKDVEPGEVIYAGDKRNPLGKIKIPLGKAYLIHQAQGPGDLGNMVSHGCIRVLRPDLEDLAEKIVAARTPSAPREKIDEALQSKKFYQVLLTPPVMVDVMYDTIVVENGWITIHPDVYKRGANTVDHLRAKLAVAGVNSSGLGDGELRRIIAQVKRNQPVMMAVEDFPRQDPIPALPAEVDGGGPVSRSDPEGLADALVYERF